MRDMINMFEKLNVKIAVEACHDSYYFEDFCKPPTLGLVASCNVFR